MKVYARIRIYRWWGRCLAALLVFAPATAGEQRAERAAELDAWIRVLRRQVRYTEAVPFAKELHELRRRADGPRHWRTRDAGLRIATLEAIAVLPIDAQTALAEADRLDADVLRVYAERGAEAARQLARRQLTVRVRWLGSIHVETARTQHMLAELHQAAGDPTTADPLYQAALTAFRRLLGDDHPDVAAAMTDWAYSRWTANDYARAASLGREALALRRRALGADHRDVATTMVKLAQILESTEALDEAENLYREALTIRRNVLGEDHPDVAATLLQLARLLELRGRHDEAERLYRQTVSDYARVLGAAHRQTEAATEALARCLVAAGRTADAARVYRELLAGRRERLGPEHAEVTATAEQLVRVLWTEGEETGSADPLRAAVQICRGLLSPDEQWLEQGLSRLTARLIAAGTDPGLEAYLQELLTLRQRLRGAEHPSVARVMSQLAAVLLEGGDLETAEHWLCRAREVGNGRRGDANGWAAGSLEQLSRVFELQGRFRAAEAVLAEALVVHRQERGELAPLTLECMERLADLRIQRGDWDGAEDLYEQLLAIRRAAGRASARWAARAVMRLGALEELKGRQQRALMKYREAVGLLAVQTQRGPAWLEANVRLASVLLTLGRAEEAEQHLKAAWDAIESGQHEAIHAALEFGLGSVRRVQGQSDAAERHFRRAHTMYRDLYGTGHPTVVACLSDLAELYRQRGDFDGAELVFRAALVPESVLASADILSFENGVGQVVPVAELFSQFLAGRGRLAEAFEMAEQGRVGRWLSVLAAFRSGLPDGLRSAGRTQVGEYLERCLAEDTSAQRVLVEARVALRAPPPSDADPDWEAGYWRQHRQQAVESAWRRGRDARVTVYEALVGLIPNANPVTLPEARKALGNAELLISYTWTPSAVTAMVIPPLGAGEVQPVIIAAGADEVVALGDRVTRLRRLLSGPGSGSGYSEQADAVQAVSEAVFGRLPPGVRKRLHSVERLVLVPGGALGGLPPAMLRLPSDEAAGGRWLIDVVPEVMCACSATAYVRGRAARSGDPRQDGSAAFDALMAAESSMGDLSEASVPSSQAAGRRVATIEAAAARVTFNDHCRVHHSEGRLERGLTSGVGVLETAARRAGGRAVCLRGSAATEAAVAQAAAEARYIHLALPGVVDRFGRAGLTSFALAARAVPGPDDDGFLSIEDLIIRWPGRLRRCELVALPACDSNEAGEHAAIVPAAFRWAGASSVLVSLWRSDEVAAALLLGRFYDKLLEPGERRPGKARALAEAQRWLRDLPGSQVEAAYRRYQVAPPADGAGGSLDRAESHPYADPRFWSGFVLWGDPE